MAQFIGRFLIISSFLMWSAQSFATRPPGTVKVMLNKERWYFDTRNITYLDWWEYLHWREHNDSVNLVLSPADSMVNLFRAKRTVERLKDIFREANALFVIGINRAQAEAYCEWRSDRVNERFVVIKIRQKVCYMLPTEEQCRLLTQKKRWKKQNIESNPFPEKGFRCIAVMTKKR